MTGAQGIRDAVAADTVLMPGVYDPLTARIAARVGFDVVFISGYSVSAARLGEPDFGLLTQTEMTEAARAVCRVSEAPVIVDADTGYGNAVNVLRTVRELQDAGAAGVFLEDQVWPKNCYRAYHGLRGLHQSQRSGRPRPRELALPRRSAQEHRELRSRARADVEMLDEETDQSGGKLNRPILEAAITGIERGRYSGIIVAKFDRLSRLDMLDALRTIARIREAGGEVFSVAEPFDASTAEGEHARNNMLSFGHMQLRKYREGFEKAKRAAVDEGIWPLPSVPLGLRKHPRTRKLVLGPEREVARMRRGFEARAAGQSWRTVSEILGVSVSTARDLIRNPVYLGEIHYGDWVNLNAHDALIDRATFEAAQLDHPRPARGKNPPALLAGIVRCAGCSRSMVVEGSRPRSYTCNAARRRTAGEEVCQTPAAIKQETLDAWVEVVALEHLEVLHAKATQRTQALADAEHVLDQAKRELDAWQKVIVAADVGPDLVVTGLRQRAENVRRAEHGLATARMAAGPLPEPQSLRNLWPDLSVEERRHVLRGALSVVWVRKGRGHVADRVRLIAGGYAPDDLSSRGHAVPLRPVEWTDDDLPGEVRPTTA